MFLLTSQIAVLLLVSSTRIAVFCHTHAHFYNKLTYETCKSHVLSKHTNSLIPSF